MEKIQAFLTSDTLKLGWQTKILVALLALVGLVILVAYPITAIGFVGGVTIGLTGIGAGSVINSLLLLFFPAISLPTIVGTAAVQGTLLKIVISYKNFLNSCMYRDQVKWIVLGALPTTVFSSSVLLKWLDNSEIFRLILYSTLILVSLVILVEALTSRSEKTQTLEKTGLQQKVFLALTGAILGLVIGATSIGTGTLMVSTLLLVMRFPVKKAISLALWSGGIILLIAAVSHIIQGHIDWHLFWYLILGSFSGILLGRFLCQYLPSKAIRIGVAVLIFYLMVQNLVRMT